MVNYTDISDVVLDNKYISESDVRQMSYLMEKATLGLLDANLMY